MQMSSVYNFLYSVHIKKKSHWLLIAWEGKFCCRCNTYFKINTPLSVLRVLKTLFSFINIGWIRDYI